MIKRLLAPTILLCACLALGACTSFSGFVTDNWPTWAGGMPKDVPPRPGAPGYEEFISHQHGNEAAAPAAAGTTPMPVAATAPPTTASVPPIAGDPNAPQLPPAYRRTDDQATTQGGLY